MRYRPPSPYCDLRRPFALAPPKSLVGFVLTPVYPRHPEFPATDVQYSSPDYFAQSYLDHVRAWRTGAGMVPAPDLSYDGVTRIVRRWFSDPDDRDLPVGNAAMLTRVLSALHAISSPYHYCGDQLFDYDRSVHPRFVVAPGTNLDTLLWLAWRYVHAFSSEAKLLADRLDAVRDDGTALRLLNDFVTRAAAVPGYDFARWADLTLSHEDLLLWPEATPFSHLRRVVIRAVRFLGRGMARGFPVSTRSRQASRLYLVDPAQTDVPDLREVNFLAYASACLDVLSALVEILRVVGHVAAVARRLVYPRHNRVGLPFPTEAITDAARLARAFRPCATVVSEIANLDPGLFDTHFLDSAARSGIDPRVWPIAEYDTAVWFSGNAWYGLLLAWGLVPGDVDNLQRAGWCIPPPGGLYFPVERFKTPVQLGTQYPARSGAPSLTERLHALQDLRLARGPMPKSDLAGADPFPWTDLTDVFDELNGEAAAGSAPA